MKIQLPTADIKAALDATITSLLSTEQQLGRDAQTQVQALIDDLYPLVVSETQSLLAAANPAVPQAYLAILQGSVEATIAKLGLTALATQRRLIASALQTGIQILGLVLKAAIVA
jgi:hypothetical protein